MCRREIGVSGEFEGDFKLFEGALFECEVRVSEGKGLGGEKKLKKGKRRRRRRRRRKKKKKYQRCELSSNKTVTQFSPKPRYPKERFWECTRGK